MTMRALAEAGRALSYYTAGKIDLARAGDENAQRRVDLLIPVVKGWCTENGSEAAWNGVQVHGGMGFIEETGAAQFMRDAKIAEIYEGTNGIQANDLIGRKLYRDRGAEARAMMAEMCDIDTALAEADFADLRIALAKGIAALEKATGWLLEAHGRDDANDAAAGAMPYLRLWGVVAGGWMMARAALAATVALNEGEGDADFMRAKIATAKFYGERILPRAAAYEKEVCAGAASLMAIADDML